MAAYRSIKSCPMDPDWWKNRGHGRRVQCRGCGRGAGVLVRPTGAVCLWCRRPLMVLTAPAGTVQAISSSVANRPYKGSRSAANASAAQPPQIARRVLLSPPGERADEPLAAVGSADALILLVEELITDA